VSNAPDLLDYLDDESKEHFENLKNRLDAIGISYTVNSRLVRGLDYYNRTVFEWITGELGSQGTICAGGRYDSLVSKLGGKETPACGFGIGIDRLQLLLEEQNIAIPEHAPHMYLVMLGEKAEVAGLKIAESLRDNIPALRLMVNNGSGSFKAQLKRADKSAAAYALILGENELEAQQIIIKPLRQDTQEINQQTSLALDKLNDYVTNTILV
jgi:histidyl-tRNA synthetase